MAALPTIKPSISSIPTNFKNICTSQSNIPATTPSHIEKDEKYTLFNNSSLHTHNLNQGETVTEKQKNFAHSSIASEKQIDKNNVNISSTVPPAEPAIYKESNETYSNFKLKIKTAKNEIKKIDKEIADTKLKIEELKETLVCKIGLDFVERKDACLNGARVPDNCPNPENIKLLYNKETLQKCFSLNKRHPMLGVSLIKKHCVFIDPAAEEEHINLYDIETVPYYKNLYDSLDDLEKELETMKTERTKLQTLITETERSAEMFSNSALNDTKNADLASEKRYQIAQYYFSLKTKKNAERGLFWILKAADLEHPLAKQALEEAKKLKEREKEIEKERKKEKINRDKAIKQQEEEKINWDKYIKKLEREQSKIVPEQTIYFY